MVENFIGMSVTLWPCQHIHIHLNLRHITVCLWLHLWRSWCFVGPRICEGLIFFPVAQGPRSPVSGSEDGQIFHCCYHFPALHCTQTLTNKFTWMKKWLKFYHKTAWMNNVQILTHLQTLNNLYWHLCWKKSKVYIRFLKYLIWYHYLLNKSHLEMNMHVFLADVINFQTYLFWRIYKIVKKWDIVSFREIPKQFCSMTTAALSIYL